MNEVRTFGFNIGWEMEGVYDEFGFVNASSYSDACVRIESVCKELFKRMPKVMHIWTYRNEHPVGIMTILNPEARCILIP